MAIELSGSEGSGLAFIAQYPDSKYVKEVMDHFVNQHAKNIAKAILGETEGISQDEISCARSLQAWATKKVEDAKQTKQQRINQLNRVIQEAQSELRQLEGKK